MLEFRQVVQAYHTTCDLYVFFLNHIYILNQHHPTFWAKTFWNAKVSYRAYSYVWSGYVSEQSLRSDFSTAESFPQRSSWCRNE